MPHVPARHNTDSNSNSSTLPHVPDANPVQLTSEQCSRHFTNEQFRVAPAYRSADQVSLNEQLRASNTSFASSSTPHTSSRGLEFHAGNSGYNAQLLSHAELTSVPVAHHPYSHISHDYGFQTTSGATVPPSVTNFTSETCTPMDNFTYDNHYYESVPGTIFFVRRHFNACTDINAPQPGASGTCINPRCACQAPGGAQVNIHDNTSISVAPNTPFSTQRGVSAVSGYRFTQQDTTPVFQFLTTASEKAPAAITGLLPTAHATSNAAQPLTAVQHKLPTLPNFDVRNPELWFALIEQILAYHNLLDDAKFICLISYFNEHKEHIYNLLHCPLTHNKYEATKGYILGRTSKYGNENIVHRLTEEKLADLTSLQLWIHMCTMTCIQDVPDETLFQMWLEKLPYAIQIAATSVMDKTPSERTSPADRAYFSLKKSLSSQLPPARSILTDSSAASHGRHRKDDDWNTNDKMTKFTKDCCTVLKF